MKSISLALLALVCAGVVLAQEDCTGQREAFHACMQEGRPDREAIKAGIDGCLANFGCDPMPEHGGPGGRHGGPGGRRGGPPGGGEGDGGPRDQMHECMRAVKDQVKEDLTACVRQNSNPAFEFPEHGPGGHHGGFRGRHGGQRRGGPRGGFGGGQSTFRGSQGGGVNGQRGQSSFASRFQARGKRQSGFLRRFGQGAQGGPGGQPGGGFGRFCQGGPGGQGGPSGQGGPGRREQFLQMMVQRQCANGDAEGAWACIQPNLPERPEGGFQGMREQHQAKKEQCLQENVSPSCQQQHEDDKAALCQCAQNPQLSQAHEQAKDQCRQQVQQAFGQQFGGQSGGPGPGGFRGRQGGFGGQGGVQGQGQAPGQTAGAWQQRFGPRGKRQSGFNGRFRGFVGSQGAGGQGFRGRQGAGGRGGHSLAEKFCRAQEDF